MDFKQKPSRNGYDLLTPSGLAFDLADAEPWLATGVDSPTADSIIRGFPIFWKESGLADQQQDDPETLAENHRVEALEKIASSTSLHRMTAGDNPFAELFDYRLEVSIGGPFDEGHDPFAGTRFAGLNEMNKRDYIQKNAAPLEVPLKEWMEAARYLFDLLLALPSTRFDGSLLKVGEKGRWLLSGYVQRDRGAQLTSQADLQEFFTQSNTNCIQWGPLYYDIGQVNVSHFCVAGMPRSGKTSLLRLLFQSLYRSQGKQARFVFYDPKADLLPLLYPPEFFSVERTPDEIDSEFHILNPLDARCTGWDIAQDASDDANATDLAETLFPEAGPDEEKYFAPACRDIAVAVMDALRRKSHQWTFYDLLCALQRQNVYAVLSSTERGQNAFNDFLATPGTSSEDTYKSLAVKTKSMLPAAYEWQKSKRKPISIREWIASDSKSLVLMSHKRSAKSLNRINRLLLGLLCRNLINADEPSIRTYFYLDEFEQLGRIDSIIQAAQQGASQGLHLALCLHEIGLLRRAYGAETESLLALCGFLAMLKVGGPESAKWASETLGNVEREHFSTTTHYGGENANANQFSMTANRQKTPLVLPDELMGLALPETSQQLSGYFIAPPHPRYRGSLPISHLAATLWPKSPEVAGYVGPNTALVVPDDTFITLYRLGFRRDNYTPPKDALSENNEPTHPAIQSSKTTSRKPKTDISFDFGLDD